MTELDLFFPISPLSINRVQQSDPRTMRRYKTNEAKDYESYIFRFLAKEIDQIKYFISVFDENVHAVKVAYTWNINKDKLLTKKDKLIGIRRLSKTGIDVGNPEKFTTDIIFNFLGINDALIYECTLKKVPSMEQSSIHAKISIVPLVNIPEYQDFLTT